MLASWTTMQCLLFSEQRRPGLLLLCALLMGGCGAVYPEVATPVRSVPLGKQVDPEPPANLLFIVFDKAIIPKQTRDGRKWDSVGGDAPDPFAKLLVNGKELIKTPIENNTLHPTWPNQVRANYQIERGSNVVVELWDSNPIHNGPICSVTVDFIHDKAGTGASELLCNSGARVLFHVESARPKLGLGMFYELQSQKVKVTRVIGQSPAARAGLTPGTEIVSIQGQPVEKLDSDQIRSAINANGRTGVTLGVRASDGTNKQVALKEAAMYPLVDEGVRFEF